MTIPVSKRTVPDRIVNADKLLISFQSELDNHAADDFELAVNGQPLLQGFEFCSFEKSFGNVEREEVC